MLGAAIVIFIFTSLSLMLGQLCIVSVARIGGSRQTLPMAFALGCGLLSVALSICAAVLDAPLWPSAIFCGAIILAMCANIRPQNPALDKAETAGLVFLTLVLLMLIVSPVSSPATLASNGHLPIWSDYYVHSATIYSFSSPFLLGEDIATAGIERKFYHYGPFMLPALIQSISGASGLAVSSAVLMPVGLLGALMGGAALCMKLGGISLAILTFFLLVAIPGPEDFGIRSGWYDFGWLLIASPGSGMAIGLAFASLWLTLHWRSHEHRSWQLLAVIGVTTTAIIMLRVQIFMLCAPVVLAFVLLGWSHKVRIVSLMCAGAGMATLLFVLVLSDNARTAWLGYAQPHIYFDITLSWSRHYNAVRAGLGELGTPYVQMLNLGLSLASSLGIWILAWPFLISFSAWRKSLVPFDLVVPLVVIVYIALILFMPPGSNGDISEYKHRHFVWLYMVITLGSAYIIHRHAAKTRIARVFTKLVAGLGMLAAAVTTTGQPFDRPDIRAMPWSVGYHSAPITAGIQDAAAFLLANAEPGDVFVMNAGHTRNWLGPQQQLISLSGLQAYVGRADQMLTRTGCDAVIAQNRLDIIKELDTVADWERAAAVLQDAGIRWYIRFEHEMPDWRAPGSPAFSTPDVIVYDTRAQPLTDTADPAC